MQWNENAKVLEFQQENFRGNYYFALSVSIHMIGLIGGVVEVAVVVNQNSPKTPDADAIEADTRC